MSFFRRARRAAPESAPLRDFPVFNRLSRREMRQVLRAGQEVTLPSGWTFIAEGTPGHEAYLLLKGRVAVTVRQQRIAELGPGEIVGEAALRRMRLRSATVSALTPLETLRFDRDAFAGLTRDIPAFREAIDANLTSRLHDPHTS